MSTIEWRLFLPRTVLAWYQVLGVDVQQQLAPIHLLHGLLRVPSNNKVDSCDGEEAHFGTLRGVLAIAPFGNGEEAEFPERPR